MIFRVILLSPFSFIFWLITWARKKMYDWNIIASRSFGVRTICIGNLSMGGTGKSPMTEYIIRLFEEKYKIATLSRGYKRKTKGFVEVTINSSSAEAGDEPKQFKNKFPGITVAVCEDRCAGIDHITKKSPDTEIIILDDAFQHRKVKAGLNILLTDYRKLFTRDFVFPSGTLRESSGGAVRADVIVVTKCPDQISEEEKRKLTHALSRKGTCRILFSKIKYAALRNMNDGIDLQHPQGIQHVLLFTGIANPQPLKEYLGGIFGKINFIGFRDHHEYSASDLMRIKETFNNIAAENKIIITTEKDAVRLDKPEIKEMLKGYPVYSEPIEMDFFPDDKITFNQILTDYAKHD
jgi:tetraacyldisaccharide 4'-kinase